MNSIDHEIEDYLESPMEKVEKIAKTNADKIAREKYPSGCSTEKYTLIYEKQLEIAKQRILSDMDFTEEYNRKRHIGDIGQMQREMDFLKDEIDTTELLHQSSVQDALYRAERDIIDYDLGGINLNTIVEHYRNLAEQYNQEDRTEINHIIEEALGNPSLLFGNNGFVFPKENESELEKLIYASVANDDKISVADIKKLTLQEESKKAIEKFQDNNGYIDISRLLTQLVDSRIKTSREYMSVAGEDIGARTTGVSEKSMALNTIRKTGIAGEDYYGESIGRKAQRIDDLEDASREQFHREREKQREKDAELRRAQIESMGNAATSLINQSNMQMNADNSSSKGMIR